MLVKVLFYPPYRSLFRSFAIRFVIRRFHQKNASQEVQLTLGEQRCAPSQLGYVVLARFGFVLLVAGAPPRGAILGKPRSMRETALQIGVHREECQQLCGSS
jgi:hypothetical protein